jgi:SAM-dependent methyltransferase
MSHASQREFIQITKDLFPEMFRGNRVLEIGSLDIEGSVRPFFADCEYIGLDLAPGKGVDVVCEGQKYDAPDKSFDVVISCEVMEHNPYWAETLTNMIRLLKPGGLLVMSCASIGRGEHGTERAAAGSSPFTVERGWNYYKNLTEWHVRRKVDLSPLPVRGFATNWEHCDLYFLGVRISKGGAASQRVAKFKAIYRSRLFTAILRQISRLVSNPSLCSKLLQRGRW